MTDAAPADATAAPQVVLVPVQGNMVVVANEADNSNHKSNACMYAGIVGLYLAIFLIATFANGVQFILYQIVVPGYAGWFWIWLIFTIVVAIINCSYACCYSHDGCCGSCRTCWDVTTALVYTILGIWGLLFTGGVGFQLLAGSLKTGTPAFDNMSDADKKAAEAFSKGLSSVQVGGGSSLQDWLAALAGPIMAQVLLALIGGLLSLILMIVFSMMTNTPEKQAAFAEKASTYKYLPFGAWALARCSK